MKTELKILIISENASEEYGGESILPLHYFRFLIERGEDVHLITHERVRSHLEKVIPTYLNRVIFIPETTIHYWMYWLGKKLPSRVANVTTNIISHFVTQYYQWRLARKAVLELSINIIHEPSPVSPKKPSILFKLGAPVVIGPMNGGMSFPIGFAFMESKFEKIFYYPLRLSAHLVNFAMPGKIVADVLLVANHRTKTALPKFSQGKVIQLVENGVDLNTWHCDIRNCNDKILEFVFVGRLVDWKCVDLLLKAFLLVSKHHNIRLKIIGDGPERQKLEQFVMDNCLNELITFLGWKTQQECHQLLINCHVFVLPSVRECGGAVVLEAMSVGLPVIAVNWGGPADYVTPETGILIEPSEPLIFVDDLSKAIEKLAVDSHLRHSAGKAGKKRIEEEFTWQKKIDLILDIYRQTVDDYRN